MGSIRFQWSHSEPAGVGRQTRLKTVENFPNLNEDISCAQLVPRLKCLMCFYDRFQPSFTKQCLKMTELLLCKRKIMEQKKI